MKKRGIFIITKKMKFQKLLKFFMMNFKDFFMQLLNLLMKINKC